MKVKIKNGDSFIWKGICDIRKILNRGLCIQIVQGIGVNVAKDP